jgi:NAD(P)-dependent dehydrogenase (short-subunit alcohol dehydrogenase family)
MPLSTTSSSHNHEFAGKVAFITGAGSGIGRASAQAFADRGAAVAIADVSAEASRGVANEIRRTGGQALGLTCDVTVSSDVQTALRQSTEAFGRLDFAFNNAGIEQPPLQSPTSPRINGSGFSTSTCAGFSSA